MYREALRHNRIYVLPFAAQPRLHNPSREEGWPNHPVCFAGSWIQDKYPERAEAPSIPIGSCPTFGFAYLRPLSYTDRIRTELSLPKQV